eukprot:2967902-Amphidinium_carterae.1
MDYCFLRTETAAPNMPTAEPILTVLVLTQAHQFWSRSRTTGLERSRIGVIHVESGMQSTQTKRFQRLLSY